MQKNKKQNRTANSINNYISNKKQLYSATTKRKQDNNSIHSINIFKCIKFSENIMYLNP